MTLRAQLDRLKGKAVDFFFPARCLGCGREGSFLCSPCGGALPRLLPPLCLKCGRPLIHEERCPVCLKWKLEIDGIRALFVFQGLVRQAVHQFKYNNFRALASSLALLLANNLETKPLPVEVIVPVPLHSRRLRERGYNQSGLLARELGRLTGLPVMEDSLVRVRNTPAQVTSVNSDERRTNVRRAFSCSDISLRGKQVLVVDDVCTTGATLNSCAVALNSAGAGSVWGLVLARET